MKVEKNKINVNILDYIAYNIANSLKETTIFTVDFSY